MIDNINIIGEAIVRIWTKNKGSFLESNNILWKIVDDKWIGKRSVWTYDLRSCWLEDTTANNVKSWWCGENSDYNEIFY
jgi:hypothetical protein